MMSVYQILMFLIGLIEKIIILQIIMSWLISYQILNMRQRFVAQIWFGLSQILEPIYKNIRKFLPNTGSFDLGPIVLLLGLFVFKIILNNNIHIFI
jgi:YggT family protein